MAEGGGQGDPWIPYQAVQILIPEAVVRGTFSTGHDMFKYKLWEDALVSRVDGLGGCGKGQEGQPGRRLQKQQEGR